MIQFFYAALEVCAAAAILIPVMLILNKTRFHSTKATLFYILFCGYLCGIYAVVGLPNVAYIRFDLNLNLIPFAGMLPDLSSTFLNVLLFFPLGLFLTLLWPAFRRLGPTLTAGFSLSLAIELLQIFTFRATDINDLITNTLGTLIGWAAGQMVRKVFPTMACKRPAKDLVLLFAITFGVMFFFQPLIWKVIY